MSKAMHLSELERRAREEDLAEYKRRLGATLDTTADYDFRRGWEYCLGRFGRDKGKEWTE